LCRAPVTINDSIVKVVVGVREIGHSFIIANCSIFYTPFKKQQIDKIKALKKGLEEHKSFRDRRRGKIRRGICSLHKFKSVLKRRKQ
jgi:hypothetical protein